MRFLKLHENPKASQCPAKLLGVLQNPMKTLAFVKTLVKTLGFSCKLLWKPYHFHRNPVKTLGFCRNPVKTLGFCRNPVQTPALWPLGNPMFFAIALWKRWGFQINFLFRMAVHWTVSAEEKRHRWLLYASTSLFGNNPFNQGKWNLILCLLPSKESVNLIQ